MTTENPLRRSHIGSETIRAYIIGASLQRPVWTVATVRVAKTADPRTVSLLSGSYDRISRGMA